MDLAAELDLSLPESGRSLVAAARDFARDVVTPAIADGRGWNLPDLRLACAIGLSGIEVPGEFGGAGLPFSVRVRVAEELARTDFSFSFAIINHHEAAVRIVRDGSRKAKEEILPQLLSGSVIGCTAMSEGGAGSDFGAIEMMARRSAGKWRLSGSKRWIANAQGAEIFLTFAQTGPVGDRDGVACFIVDGRHEGFVRAEPEPFSGLPLGGIGGFRLQDFTVEDDFILYPPGGGFKTGMVTINNARVHIAAMACGMVAAALDDALDHARSRTAFGRPLSENQGLAWSLADVATSLDAMRLLTYRAARLIEADPAAASRAAAMAKKFTAENTPACLQTCLRTLGARGVRDDARAMRHLRASPALGIADGTTEMMNERIQFLIVKESAERRPGPGQRG